MDEQANSTGMSKQEISPLMSVEISEIIPCEEPSLGERIWGHVQRNLLLLLTIVGVLVGFGIGFGVRPTNPSTTAIMWIGTYRYYKYCVYFNPFIPSVP